MAQQEASADSPALPCRLLGKTVCVAGSPRQGDKDNLHALINAEGGQVVETLAPTLDHLILASPKSLSEPLRRQAVQLNKTQGGHIQVLQLQDFFDLFHPDRALALTMLRAGPPGIARLLLLRNICKQPLDLSGADLRGLQMGDAGLSFDGICLDRVDLRLSNLGRSSLFLIQEARLDGVRLCGFFNGDLIGCSLRRADLSGCRWDSGRLERCDLTGANLEEINAASLQAPGVCFRQARLGSANLFGAKLAGADFTEANLQQARLIQADLSSALLQAADLHGADLTDAKLVGADLTGADLRGACLFDADLSNARIEGARFQGANVTGTRRQGIDPGKAVGLASEEAPVGKAGPVLATLAALLQQADSFRLLLQLEGAAGKTVGIDVSGQGGQLFSSSWAAGETSYFSQSKTGDAILLDMARRWPGYQLSLSGIKVQARGIAVTNRELKSLVLNAWSETNP